MPSTVVALALALALARGAAGEPFPAPYCGPNPADGASHRVPPLSAAASRALAGHTLRHVHVMVRHGDRTPMGWYWQQGDAYGKLKCWPGDDEPWRCRRSYASSSPPSGLAPRFRIAMRDGHQQLRGNCGQGYLTDRGFAQLRANGAALRAAYYGGAAAGAADAARAAVRAVFVNASSVRVRSTNILRTMLSAQAVVAGMLPDATAPGAPALVLNTSDLATDALLGDNAALCPRLAEVKAAARASERYQQFVRDELEPLSAELADAIGVPRSALQDDGARNMLVDCIAASWCHNRSAPAALVPQLRKRALAALTEGARIAGTTPTPAAVARLGIGSLLRELAPAFASPPATPLLHVMAAHDTSLFPLLLALGIGSDWPPYASMFVLETYWRDGAAPGTPPSFVRIAYNDALVTQQVPTCAAADGIADSALCPWALFAKHLHSITRVDDTECAPQAA